MLLSGHSPLEMCERWRTLRVADFVSPLPVRDYLRAPHLAAFGGADGIVDKVFPHLGVDVERIREADGIVGTFNVCNHSAKTNESVEHIGTWISTCSSPAISLPMLMPAVRRSGLALHRLGLDQGREPDRGRERGAEELWIVWCIGNTPEYRDGPFNQYVHMIEQSANGVLFEEFDRIRDLNDEIRGGRAQYGQRRPIVAHVIAPRYPLPLDPDFYLGRIDATTLIAMGYRDARAYMATMDSEQGTPLTPEATRMQQPARGVSWRQARRGRLTPTTATASEATDGSLSVELVAEVADAETFIAGPRRVGRLVGRLRGPLVGDVLVREGTVTLEHGALVYDAWFDRDGSGYRLTARQQVGAAGPTLRRLCALGALDVVLRDERGARLAEGRLGPAGGRIASPLPDLRATNADSTRQRLATAGRLPASSCAPCSAGADL